MPLHFTTRMVGPVFCVSLVGTVDSDGAREMYGHALRACVDGGCTWMLVDAREAAGELSTLDRFDFGKYVAEKNTEAEGHLGSQLRVAVVAHPPLIDPATFGQVVAVNRGASLRVTSAVDEAFRWFGIAPPSEPSSAPPGE